MIEPVLRNLKKKGESRVKGKAVLTRQVLTRQEERELAERISEGDEAAREKLILHNIPLVVSIAGRLCKRKSDFLSDMAQIGMFGLIRATKDFDPERGTKFSTYATYWIRQTILREAPKLRRVIYLPAYREVELSHFIRRKEEKEAIGEVAKSDEEVFEEMEISPEARRSLMRALQVSMQPMSLEAPARNLSKKFGDRDASPLGETISDEEAATEEDIIERIARREKVERILNLPTLTAKEREVLMMFFGFDGGGQRTLHETGKRFGITRERTRQIKEKAIKKIRKELGML